MAGPFQCWQEGLLQGLASLGQVNKTVSGTVFSGASFNKDECFVGDASPCNRFLEYELDRSSYNRDGEMKNDHSPTSCQNVCGSDIGDIPTHYVVKDLYPHELPVIGTYIDRSILPGFKYRIRLLGSRKYLFDEQALTLDSIGMGYGRRITMEGGKENYFYSDTYSDGCGFQIVVVQPGDRFVIRDKCDFPIGKAEVDIVHSQKEISTEADHINGTVQKVVNVSLTCSVKYGSEPHGILPLCSDRSIQVSAPAFIMKPKQAKTAVLSIIKNIYLPTNGTCSFQPCV